MAYVTGIVKVISLLPLILILESAFAQASGIQFGQGSASCQIDPGESDTVRVESLSLPLGSSSFVLKVYLSNDEELGGFKGL